MNTKFKKELQERSGGKCELCGTEGVENILVENMDENEVDSHLSTCNSCKNALVDSSNLSGNEWKFLNESIWSEIPSIKISSWRLLNKIDETWAKDTLEMAYLEDDLLEIAKSTQKTSNHYDSNGNPLFKGDTVTIIKDLDVKGTSIVAKRGTVVKSISLDPNDDNLILGKVNGQLIYLLSKYVKK